MQDNILSINYVANMRRDNIIYQYSRTERALRATMQNTFDAVLSAELEPKQPEGIDPIIARMAEDERTKTIPERDDVILSAVQETKDYRADITGRYDSVLTESAGKYFASMRMRSLRRA